ncbi:MAG: type III pantothenate kinase [Bernardetiaceae bacterium]|nr:type III pantothenate kinase [Bernardetiaceae bacterium]
MASIWAVDIGNSLAKIGYFENGILTSVDTQITLTDIQQLARLRQPTHIVATSVRADDAIWTEALERIAPLLWLKSDTDIPIQNQYRKPEQLGTDRLAAVIGAQAIFPKAHNLVIDAGSCITYDFITIEKIYKGGSISPGLRMRFEAMHRLTAKLPLVPTPNTTLPLEGGDTQESMQIGVVRGIIGEIQAQIEAYKGNYRNFNVILCGGDADFFEKKIKTPNFVHLYKEVHLVLKGLAAVLQHQKLPQPPY